MNNLDKLTIFIKEYLPLFFLLCFSGNPIITSGSYSKILLTGYTLLFFIYILLIVDLKMFKKVTGILFVVLVFIIILVFFQRIILGFVSYPGLFRYLLKIMLGLSVLLFYEYNKIDFIETYIKILAFLAIISIPFWILNQFGFYGLQLEGGRKSLFIYTTLLFSDGKVARNSGMFWEPGAFSGYLVLALVFVALKNGKFQIGPYRKEVFLILTGLITTMSTSGFVILGIILTIYTIQNYPLGKIILFPMLVLLMSYAYYNLEFLKEKIDNQLNKATELEEDDISNSRFGALKMDLQYIKSQPVIGNGLHIKTRYRFHPQVKGDIGHGNGMSNFLASWGIPFFLFWLYCVFRFAKKVSHSKLIAIAAVIIIILLLQGEQFLNYPMFLSFFVSPFIYQNIMSVKNKIHFIKTSFNFKLSM